MLSFTSLGLHGFSLRGDRPTSFFFQNRSKAIPLSPFIHAYLVKPADCDRSNNLTHSEEEPDENDPDDDFLTHPCPDLVNLAVLLLELYLTLPIHSLAEKYGIELSSSRGSMPLFFEVDLVFQHCKPDIPEYSGFVIAVDNCLSPNLWRDENYEALHEQSLRSAIYQEVVQPLEDELNRAFSTISLEKLDDEAQRIDFANWGQTVHNETLNGQTPCNGSTELVHSSRHHSPSHQSQRARKSWHGGSRAGHKPEHASFSFFDDEMRHEDISEKA